MYRLFGDDVGDLSAAFPAASSFFSVTNIALAVPVPDPAPLAVNLTPTVLLAAPIDTKFVFPTETIS